MPRLTIVSYYTPNYSEYGKLMLKDKEPYCKKHGYSLVLYKECVKRPEGANPHWCKFQALLKAMDGDTSNADVVGDSIKSEWYVWMDVDTIIINDTKKLDVLLDECLSGFTGRHFVASYAVPQFFAGLVNKKYIGNYVNSGVFFVKNTDEGKEMLRYADSRLQWKKYPLSDQLAIADACIKWPERILRVKRSIFNASIYQLFPDMSVREDSVLVHINALNKNKCLETLRGGKLAILRYMNSDKIRLFWVCMVSVLLLLLAYKSGNNSLYVLAILLLAVSFLCNFIHLSFSS